MSVKTTWIDPNSGKEYSYNWGFGVDSTIPKKKNYADYYRMNGEEKELETALKRRMSNTMYGAYSNHANCKIFVTPQIKNVIFNPPATIVFWNDGTKTVVKCQNQEEFDHEKGLAMAFFKKMHGNKGHYFEEIKKWTEKDGD